MRTVPAILATALLLAATSGCGEGGEAPPLPRADEPLTLVPSDFVAEIDNRYWPMSPGTRWVYTEEGDDGEELRVEVTVTDDTKVVAGIEATVVHDIVTRDGELVEDTYDWYAQDEHGNVWYLGEATEEYEDGKIVSTGGSWEAGVDGALAGVIMPADPTVGLAYRQEHLAGEAEDRAEVIGLDGRATVPYGTFEGVLVTEDTTPLQPDVREHKYYAPDVGPVLTIDVAGGGAREELVEFEPGG